MSKPLSKSSELNRLPFTDDLSEFPLIEWISANRKAILTGFISLLAILVITYRVISARALSSEKDFFQVQADFNRFEKETLNAPEAQEILEQLNQLLNRHPELHAKYDGLIAENLLIHQKADQAQPFAQFAFERTKQDHLNFYHDYAATSLLIGKGHYQEALAAAQQLKEKMAQETNEKGTSPILYLFNLIRLAVLNQKLGDKEGEYQNWKELQYYQGDVRALVTINELFKEGEFSLSKYITERNKVLTADKAEEIKK